MTRKRTDGDAADSTDAKQTGAKQTDAAAAARRARGSVHEAIGKLIGDDAVEARGAAEKKAGTADADDRGTSSRR